MSQSALKSEPRILHAAMSYALDTGVKPVAQTGGKDGLERKSTTVLDSRIVPIEDVRPLRATLSLDVEGFEFVDQPTAMTDFLNEDELRTVYYREMEALIGARTGCARVHLFVEATARSL